MITITIINKYQDDRSAISALVKEQEDFKIIYIGTDAYDAIKSAEIQQPNIIIMDDNIQDIDILDIAPIIKRKSPSTAFIVLYSHVEQQNIIKALKAGISGFLLRQDIPDNLDPSIRSVRYGGWYISKSVRDIVMNDFPLQTDEFPVEWNIPMFYLTPTETSILYDIIRGYSDREIAKDLHLHIGTIRNNVNQLKKRTGLHNRTQILVYALLNKTIRMGRIKDL